MFRRKSSSKEAKSQDVQSSSTQMTDNESVERLLEYVSSPAWHHPISTFMDRESVVFEVNNTETNEDQQQQIHRSVFDAYKRLIDILIKEGEIQSGLINHKHNDNNAEAEKNSVSSEARRMLLFVARQSPAVGQDIINVFHMYDSYEFFQQKMAERSVELQLEVLELIEREYGKFPENFFLPTNNNLSETRQKEEERDLAQAIEMSKLEYEKELVRHNSEKLLITNDNNNNNNVEKLKARRDKLLVRLTSRMDGDELLERDEQKFAPTSILLLKQNSELHDEIPKTTVAKQKTVHNKVKFDDDVVNKPIIIKGAGLEAFAVEQAGKIKRLTAMENSVKGDKTHILPVVELERRRNFLLQQREKLVAARSAKRTAELLDSKHLEIHHVCGKPTTLSQASEAHQSSILLTNKQQDHAL